MYSVNQFNVIPISLNLSHAIVLRRIDNYCTTIFSFVQNLIVLASNRELADPMAGPQGAAGNDQITLWAEHPQPLIPEDEQQTAYPESFSLQPSTSTLQYMGPGDISIDADIDLSYNTIIPGQDFTDGLSAHRIFEEYHVGLGYSYHASLSEYWENAIAVSNATGPQGSAGHGSSLWETVGGQHQHLPAPETEFHTTLPEHHNCLDLPGPEQMDYQMTLSMADGMGERERSDMIIENNQWPVIIQVSLSIRYCLTSNLHIY